MITLTVVAPGIDPAEFTYDLLLQSPAEYPSAYQRIVGAIHAGHEFHVLITDRILARWFKVLAQRYGSDQVAFREITLRSLLESRIGLTIPPEISDVDIQSSELMDLNIPASGQASFSDYLLDVFLGSFLIRSQSVFRVNEVMAAYEPEQWQLALKRPLIRGVYQDWLRQQHTAITARVDHQAELQLLTWLEASPETYIRNLSAIKLLSGYPESLGERVFGPVYRALNALNLDLRRVPIILEGNEAVLDEIRLYLHQLDGNSLESLDALLEQVSGNLEIELDFVIGILRASSVSVNKQLIQRVQRKFDPLRSQPHLAQALADLELMISVPPPSLPNFEWSVKEWLEWATKEYLPYRFWLENTGQLDDTIADLAGEFSDWLYQNYGSLRYHSNHMAWKAALGLRNRIESHEGPVLIVMIDNFNAKFYPILQRQLQQQGFYEQDFQYCLSMLPSFTEVSKKCIMTGHYAPFNDSSYGPDVIKSWSKKISKKVYYLANISELRKVNNPSHDVFFLNYLPIDFTLHQVDSHTGISHNQAVQVYLKTLAQDIRGFARRLSAERDLMVIFLSDHGSTRIPSGTVNVISNKYYQKYAIDEHHRCITISDEEAEKLSDQVKYECYLFRRSEYDLPENYLVARRLFRFKPTEDSVYIHGGLTPEETIVPLAVFQPVTVKPRPLHVRLVEPRKINAGTRPELSFEITNLNSYPVEQLSFNIVDSNLESTPLEIAVIDKLQRCSFKVRARCPSNADTASKHIQVELSFLFVGQKNEQSAKVDAVFDTLVKTRFDLSEF